MIRLMTVIGVFAVMTAVFAATAQADVIIEDFSYGDQSDVSGPDFRITTDGMVGGSGVVEWSEGLASGASIASGVLLLDTIANPSASQDFVGIVDIPGFTPLFGGPIGTFFSSGPRNLSEVFGSIDIAHTAGNNATRFRLYAVDDDSNEIVTADFTLGSTMTTYGFVEADFTILLPGSTTFNETIVTSIGIEFFATPDAGAVQALRFQVDNFVLNVIPEPGSLMVLFSGSIALLFRRRRFVRQ